MTDDLAAQIEQIINERYGRPPEFVSFYDAKIIFVVKAHLDRDRKMKAELADGEKRTIAILYQSYIEGYRLGKISRSEVEEKAIHLLAMILGADADSLGDIETNLRMKLEAADSKTEASE